MIDPTINLLLESMTYETSYEFLEVGKHDNELNDVAKNFGLKLPAQDIAIFKGRYALTDKVNRNGCRLPRAEVISALVTLRGKAVDFDHLRKKVCGFWLDAKLQGNQIISYGAFYRGNFPEEYDTIKQLMSEGNLKISFEAYGKREPIKGTSDYNLTGIEFAGGALLLTEKPAEPTAEVLELAKILTPPKSLHLGVKPDTVQSDNSDKDRGTVKGEDKLLKGKNKEMDKNEFAKLHITDMETIMTLLRHLEDSKGNRIIPMDILRIDFELNKVWITGVKEIDDEGNIETDANGNMVIKTYEVTLTPRSKLVETAQKVVNVREVKSESEKKIDKETNKANKELNMDEDTKKAEAEKKEAAEKAKTQEVESLKTEVAGLKEQIKTKDEEVKSLTEKVETYEKSSKDRKLTERTTQLGETAKDMKEEDIMDDHKFEVAIKDKEIAELKEAVTKGSPEKGKITIKGLNTGSKNKETEDRIAASAKKVDGYAFGNK